MNSSKSQFLFEGPFIGLIAGILILGIFFQNCSRSFQADLNGNQFDSASMSGTDCLAFSIYDACIFEKNPWIQGNEFQPGQQYHPSQQSLGIHLPEELKANPFQTSSKIKILSPLQTHFDGAWKVPVSLASADTLNFLMIYYWSNQVRDFLKSADGTSVFDSGITIQTDSKVTGWSTTLQSIYLKGRIDSQYQGFDASLLVHLMGEAAIALATKNKIYEIKDRASKLEACGPPGKPLYLDDCCKTSSGCSPAVSAGLSDFLVALMFPKFPAVGDGVSTDPQGLTICGLHRDPRANEAVSAQQAFSNCQAPSENRPGFVYSMAVFYNSLWWSVHNQLLREQTITETQFKQFFLEVISSLDGDDDFLTVLEKIRQIDSAKYGSKVYEVFRSEYQRRHLI